MEGGLNRRHKEAKLMIVCCRSKRAGMREAARQARKRGKKMKNIFISFLVLSSFLFSRVV